MSADDNQIDFKFYFSINGSTWSAKRVGGERVRYRLIHFRAKAKNKK